MSVGYTIKPPPSTADAAVAKDHLLNFSLGDKDVAKQTTESFNRLTEIAVATKMSEEDQELEEDFDEDLDEDGWEEDSDEDGF